MIVLHVTLRFAPEDIDQFVTRLPELAMQTRAEDGCIEYLFGRDLLDPDLIQITECWESEAAIELHKTTDHFRNFIAAMPQMLGFSRRAYTAEPVTEAKTSALSA
jgi:quinol monooxygenase YgiN